MVCYVIPLAGAVISTVFWFAGKRGPGSWWLNLFLYGGAMFGFVDHLWHGELLLVSSDWVMDLMLGGTITAAIFAGWGVTLGLATLKPELGYRMGILKPLEKD